MALQLEKLMAEMPETVPVPIRSWRRFWSVLLLCVLYYVVLGEVSIPRVTIGILSFSITISIFEVATIVFLIAMMAFMGCGKVPVLILVPVCTSLF